MWDVRRCKEEPRRQLVIVSISIELVVPGSPGFETLALPNAAARRSVQEAQQRSAVCFLALPRRQSSQPRPTIAPDLGCVSPIDLSRRARTTSVVREAHACVEYPAATLIHGPGICGRNTHEIKAADSDAFVSDKLEHWRVFCRPIVRNTCPSRNVCRVYVFTLRATGSSFGQEELSGSVRSLWASVPHVPSECWARGLHLAWGSDVRPHSCGKPRTSCVRLRVYIA
ncbi:hypothetical protein C8Q72DRAFT_255246 [Fomitopsis betulina]|nr:hypothetical protein C8Q72DRAFT_255246 [Fomitopsis betulina]